MADVRISWISRDGEELEEAWPSVARFLAWASGEGLRCSWRAFREDADGEWELVDEGRL